MIKGVITEHANYLTRHPASGWLQAPCDTLSVGARYSGSDDVSNSLTAASITDLYTDSAMRSHFALHGLSVLTVNTARTVGLAQ